MKTFVLSLDCLPFVIEVVLFVPWNQIVALSKKNPAYFIERKGEHQPQGPPEHDGRGPGETWLPLTKEDNLPWNQIATLGKKNLCPFYCKERRKLQPYGPPEQKGHDRKTWLTWYKEDNL